MRMDDIDVGKYYAAQKGPTRTGYSMFGCAESEDITMNGIPFRVMHVSLPFLFIEMGEVKKNLDCSHYHLVRVDEEYYKLFWNNFKEQTKTAPNDYARIEEKYS